MQAGSARSNQGKRMKDKKNEEEEEEERPIVQDNTDSAKNEERIETKVEIQVKRPPKKMVSINENVEVIYQSHDKRKRNRSFDKLPSIDEQKPMKSILKVSSNLIDKQQGVEPAKL